MKVYILFEERNVKYVSTKKKNIMRIAKQVYKLDNNEQKILFEYGACTTCQFDPNKEPFVTISVQEVETDTIINP